MKAKQILFFAEFIFKKYYWFSVIFRLTTSSVLSCFNCSFSLEHTVILQSSRYCKAKLLNFKERIFFANNGFAISVFINVNIFILLSITSDYGCKFKCLYVYRILTVQVHG